MPTAAAAAAAVTAYRRRQRQPRQKSWSKGARCTCIRRRGEAWLGRPSTDTIHRARRTSPRTAQLCIASAAFATTNIAGTVLTTRAIDDATARWRLMDSGRLRLCSWFCFAGQLSSWFCAHRQVRSLRRVVGALPLQPWLGDDGRRAHAASRDARRGRHVQAEGACAKVGDCCCCVSDMDAPLILRLPSIPSAALDCPRGLPFDSLVAAVC